MSAARRTVAALLVVVAGGVYAAPPPLNAGFHAAELCVATLPRPASCGPVKAELRADGSMRLRIDDITYTLTLHSSQVDVIVMHNIVQIDGFTAPCEWLGRTLQFVDNERRARYEVRFPPATGPTR